MKILWNKDQNQDNKLRKKVLRKRTLTLAMTFIASSMATLTTQASINQIGDLSIYKSADQGGANIVMMYDVSGSMGMVRTSRRGYAFPIVGFNSIYADSGINCVNGGSSGDEDEPWLFINGLGRVEKEVTVNGHSVSYTLEGCVPGEMTSYDRKYKRYKTSAYSTASSPAKKFYESDIGEYFYIPSHNMMYKGSAFVNQYNYKRYTRSLRKIKAFTPTNPDDWDWNYGKKRWEVAENRLDVDLEDTHLDRLSRLKKALIAALGKDSDGNYLINSTNVIGMGQFSSGQIDDRDGETGQILVPAKELTEAHRETLIRAVAMLEAKQATPSANAYAEAGAYMLGTTTKSSGYPSGFDKSIIPDIGVDSAEIKNSTHYIKPADDDKYQCYGKGIYFLTDGEPNKLESTTSAMMAKTLIGVSPAKTMGAAGTGLSKVGALYSDSGWDEIGRYAKVLRNHQSRFSDIRTATVGFGAAFAALGTAEKISITNAKGNQERIINCEATKDKDGNTLNVSQDGRNLCRWGEKEDYNAATQVTNKKYGGGGFTAAKSSEDIKESLVTFIKNGKDNLGTAPAGTISIPKSPYRATSVSPYAYLPMLEADADGDMQVWRGNLKKYETKSGTLYGKGDNRLYSSPTSTEKGGDLVANTADLWSDVETTGGQEVQSGGFYARLLVPQDDTVDSVRNVYVESYSAGNVNGFMKVGVSGGSPNNFTFSDTVYGAVNTPKLAQSKRKVLNLLGFEIPTKEDAILDNTNIATLDMKDYLPDEPNTQRTLGGVIHSSPALVSYYTNVNEDGLIETDADERDEYVLFGSMDGTLHLADAATGEEKWALVLQEMFRKQPDALVWGSSGALKFGIDAPWLVHANYEYNSTEAGTLTTRKVQLQTRETSGTGADASVVSVSNYVPMAAYGGFRMGSNGLYSLDLQDVNSPKILFKITPTATSTDEKPKLHNNAGTASSSTDYDNVGQIWSQVSMAKLIDTHETKPKQVIVFGGGYDMAYEDTGFIPAVPVTNSNRTKGSSVYVADAETGEKIWSWDNPYNHSIVGGVTVLDRDNDGLFDYLYFADLGGNVFRADFINQTDNSEPEKGVSFENVRVVRVLNASEKLTDKSLAYRFYNKPTTSFYEDEAGDLFTVVNIASGNRSSPLSDKRDATTANKIYGIIDREVTNGKLLLEKSGPSGSQSYTADSALTINNLTEDNLKKLGGEVVSAASESTNSGRVADLCSPEKDADGKIKKDSNGNFSYSSKCKKKVTVASDIMDQASSGSSAINGWYYNLTRFNGLNGIHNIKAIGDYAVINRYLYMSAYEHNIKDNGSLCDAQIFGASESQLYCLPYGICMDDSSKTGSGGFSPAGKGLQELALGALNKDKTNVKVLIGTQSLPERKANAVEFGDPSGGAATGVPECETLVGVGVCDDYKDATTAHGDGTMADLLFNERFILTVPKWYELNE